MLYFLLVTALLILVCWLLEVSPLNKTATRIIQAILLVLFVMWTLGLFYPAVYAPWPNVRHFN